MGPLIEQRIGPKSEQSDTTQLEVEGIGRKKEHGATAQVENKGV